LKTVRASPNKALCGIQLFNKVPNSSLRTEILDKTLEKCKEILILQNNGERLDGQKTKFDLCQAIMFIEFGNAPRRACIIKLSGTYM